MAITVDHWEVTDFRRRSGLSANERWTGNGQFEAYCLYWCAWSDRNTLIEQMGAEDGGAGQLYPHATTFGARIYAANVIGWGRSSTSGSSSVLCDYENALVTAFYSTEAPYWAGPLKFVSEEIRPYKDEFARSHYGKTWTSTGAQIRPDDMPSLVLDSFVYVLTFHRVLAVPAGAYNLMGHTNLYPVQSYTLDILFPTQSLRYPGPAIIGGIRLASLPMKTVTYQLPFRRDPWTNTGAWNMHWNPATGRFDTITDADYGVEVPYPVADFAALVP